MKLLERASKLLKANINHMLDAAEDPEVMIKDLIREMDESVAELRRETVNAVARQKQLENKVQARNMIDKFNMHPDEAKKLWTYGCPPDALSNILIDAT